MKAFRRGVVLLVLLCLSAALWLSPAAFAQEESFDPYTYYFAPANDLVPEYYQFYAKPAMYSSPHYVKPHGSDREDCAFLFNMVNVAELIWDQAQAPEGGYATFNGYCADRATGAQPGSAYRRLNLENGYFCTTEAGVDLAPARGIRAVMRHTYPAVQDMDQITAAANAYLTQRYGSDAVLVQDLTGAELLAASQSAVWHYSNGEDFSAPYPYSRTEDYDSFGEFFCNYYFYPQMMYLDGFCNIREKQRDVTASNMNGIYEYLINLPGEDAKDVVITENSLELLGAMYCGDSMTFLVGIDGTVNANDDLVLSASCGDSTEAYSLGKTMELDALAEGVYAVAVDAETFVSGRLQLQLSGIQTVADVCFMEAKPMYGKSARDTSQNMVIHSNDSAPVMATLSQEIPQSRELQITKVDEASGKPLAGVTFDLYMKLDGQELKLDSYTTDKNGNIRVYVADDGNDYYFKENKALPGYEAAEGTFTGGTVSNTMSVGDLEVSKKLINTTAAKPHEFFHFQLTLDLSTAPVAGNELPWLNGEYLAEQLEGSKELEWTVAEDGKLTTTFTLKADETIQIGGIPMGTTYSLEEILAPKDRLIYSVTTKIGDGKETASTEAEGTIARKNAVLYTNTLHAESNPQTGDIMVLPVLTVLLLATALLLRRRSICC